MLQVALEERWPWIARYLFRVCRVADLLYYFRFPNLPDGCLVRKEVVQDFPQSFWFGRREGEEDEDSHRGSCTERVFVRDGLTQDLVHEDASLEALPIQGGEVRVVHPGYGEGTEEHDLAEDLALGNEE